MEIFYTTRMNRIYSVFITKINQILTPYESNDVGRLFT